MHRCPNCGSENIHISRTRGRWEQFRKAWSKKRPHRCHTCEWRGWGFDFGPKFRSDDIAIHANAIAQEAPDLREDD